VEWYYLRRGPMLPHFVVALTTDLTTVGIEQLQNPSLGVKGTDPRDRVYALLGLFPPAVAKLFQSEYCVLVFKSIPI
jgi:hypothetical protein